jgi:hypothetical protein
MGSAMYPPASYALLWPLIGWGGFGTAKTIWLISSLAAVAVLSHQMVTHSQAKTLLERLFIALIPFSVYATGATIGNGQLIVHVLPLLLLGVLWTCNHETTPFKTWLGVLSMLVALVQPAIAAPFFWLVVFVPNRTKSSALVVGGYLLLTLFAISFQLALVSNITASRSSQGAVENRSGPLVGDLQQGAASGGAVMENWSTRVTWGTQRGATTGGYANVHSLLMTYGWGRWNMHASLLMLAGLGVWVFFNRKADLWLLIGVSAIFARFWTYHRWYNDLLLLLPLISLYRLTRHNESSDMVKVTAGTLFAICLILSIAPGGLYLFPYPFNLTYVYVQIAVWVTVLIFLIAQAFQDRQRVQSIQPA